MNDSPQHLVYRLLKDELGQGCDLRECALEIPVMQDCLPGGFDYTLPIDAWWFFIDTFVDDADERARIHRAAEEPRRCFRDLARLHYHVTGEVLPPPPPEILRFFEMRYVAALRPSLYEIATGATRHAIGRVSSILKDRTTEGAWRTKLSK